MEDFDHLELFYLSIFALDLWFLKVSDKVLIAKKKGLQKEKRNRKNENKINGVAKPFDVGFHVGGGKNKKCNFIQTR